MPSVWEFFVAPSPQRKAHTPTGSPRNSQPASPSRRAADEGSSSSAPPVYNLNWASSSSDAVEPKLLDANGRIMTSQMLTPFALRQLAVALPSRFAYADWRLLYSTAVHGISLNTMYIKAAGCGCCLLVLRDAEGNVFGGFSTEWREPSASAKFYGGGEAFLFSIERCRGLPPLPVGDEPPPDEAVHVHRWTGANSFFTLSHGDHLAMGSGGHFGLYLDSELLHGSSGPSETFGNECLCRQRADGPFDDAPAVGEFRCDVLEVWGMEHAAIARRQQEQMLRGLRNETARSFQPR